jgi:hypothetical protein
LMTIPSCWSSLRKVIGFRLWKEKEEHETEGPSADGQQDRLMKETPGVVPAKSWPAGGLWVPDQAAGKWFAKQHVAKTLSQSRHPHPAAEKRRKPLMKWRRRWR